MLLEPDVVRPRTVGDLEHDRALVLPRPHELVIFRYRHLDVGIGHAHGLDGHELRIAEAAERSRSDGRQRIGQVHAFERCAVVEIVARERGHPLGKPDLFQGVAIVERAALEHRERRRVELDAAQVRAAFEGA